MTEGGTTRVGGINVDWRGADDRLTAEEQQEIVSWYETHHGDGTLELTPYVPFWLQNEPGELKRFRRWVATVHAMDGRLSSAAAQLILMHTYVVIGYDRGALYELIGARKAGATKQQVLETLSAAWVQTGPPGMAPIAAASMDYLRGWDPVEAPNPAIWPEDWSYQPNAMTAGLDYSTDSLLDGELADLRRWYEANYGEVPSYVDFLATHNPEGLKTFRYRYENVSRGALPTEIFPLFSFFTAAYHANGRSMRRAAHHARVLGARKAHVTYLAALVMYHAADLEMDTIADAMTAILAAWPD